MIVKCFLFVLFKSTGHCDSSLALPREVLTTIQSQLCNPEDVVHKLLQNLQLEQSSLEQPEPETRKWIRCLAKKANNSNRLDVVKYLRQIAPAGTTGRCDTGIVVVVGGDGDSDDSDDDDDDDDYDYDDDDDDDDDDGD